MGTVSKEQAQKPLVMTMDVGSSSLRVSLYDGSGHSIEGFEIKSAYQLDTTPDGGVEKDPDELVEIVGQAIDKLLNLAGPLAKEIAGVAIDTFWHSLMGLNKQGQPTTPLLTWADTRSAATAQQLTREVDETAIHSRTGCKLHPTYFPSKLRWLAQSQPVVFRRTQTWLSFGEYLYLRYFGQAQCSLSMASGTGLFDQNTRQWDAEMLKVSRVKADQLLPLGDFNTPLKGLLPEFARRWPTLADIPWFLAVGDGAAGNLGSGCFSHNRIAVMVGTSGAMRVCWPAQSVKIPWGLWCYHADYNRFVMGGALSEGGNFFAWTRKTFQLPSIAESEHELSMMEPDGHNLTVLPFLTGERSPGWNASARAAITGLSLDTKPIEILRAGLESIAYRFGLLYEIMAANLQPTAQIIASGGALLASPTWMQILADVLDRPVIASDEGETTSRGAALLALEQLGAFTRPDHQDGDKARGNLDQAQFSFGQTYQPDSARHNRYKDAMERQKVLYSMLVKTQMA